jgi:hypothetical protein
MNMRDIGLEATENKFELVVRILIGFSFQLNKVKFYLSFYFTRENYFTNNDQFNKKKSAKAHKKNNLKKNTSKLHKFVSKKEFNVST